MIPAPVTIEHYAAKRIMPTAIHNTLANVHGVVTNAETSCAAKRGRVRCTFYVETTRGACTSTATIRLRHGRHGTLIFEDLSGWLRFNRRWYGVVRPGYWGCVA